MSFMPPIVRYMFLLECIRREKLVLRKTKNKTKSLELRSFRTSAVLNRVSFTSHNVRKSKTTILLGIILFLEFIPDKHPCYCVEIELALFFEYLAINRKNSGRGSAANEYTDLYLLTSPSVLSGVKWANKSGTSNQIACCSSLTPMKFITYKDSNAN